MTTAAPARHRAILFLFICSLTAANADMALAQARLEGRVLDAQGRPVAAATVVAVGSTGAATATVSDPDGVYAFDELPAGSYDLLGLGAGIVGRPRRRDRR